MSETSFYRRKTTDTEDFYPTPPWCTRALFQHVLKNSFVNMTCLEPACGKGHMSKVLNEYFTKVYNSDINFRGYGWPGDFLSLGSEFPFTFAHFNWIITNPPYLLAEEFILQALRMAGTGVAMFCRLQMMEGIGRYNRIFKDNPPHIIAPFSERPTLNKNIVSRKGGGTIAYAWCVWDMSKYEQRDTKVLWIPPCRKQLEKDEDYV